MSESLRSIQACEDRLRAAQLAGDVAALDELLADDLIGTDQFGQTFTKADDLAMHRAGLVTINRVDLKGQHVRDFGDVVVVIAHTTLAGSFRGEDFDGGMRYTRIWHQRGGRWQIAAAHLSPMF